jgi:serine/threonine protein kinase
MEPRVIPNSQSLWTGPREDPRRYRVDLVDGELLSTGDGGEGLVFQATMRLHGDERRVALKMHTSLTHKDFAWFSQRARSLCDIDHPHIMQMVDVFVGTALVNSDEIDDDAFNVMYTVADWVPGLSLPAALETSNVVAGLRWVSEVARATAYLHALRSPNFPEGVIHRDIKPSNVRITTDQRAVLIDFGIARPHQKGDLTEGAGTYLWKAPEVVGGPGDPGPASDVWGVGALAYWVLMGEPPRLEGAEVARRLLTPVASHVGVPDPVGLSRAIAELLETHPNDRPTDLLRWADELSVSLSRKRRRPIHSALYERSITSRRFAALLVTTIVAVAAVTAVLATGPSSNGSTRSAFFVFKPESFSSGLIVDRTWRLLGASGYRLEGTTTLVNGNAGALHTSYDEVLPKSIGASVHHVAFTPENEKVIETDSVVRYKVDLAYGASKKLTFAVDVGSTHGQWSRRLRILAQAELQAEAEYRVAARQTTPASLTTLILTPSTIVLAAGQTRLVSLAGTMSDGTAATPAVLTNVSWHTSAAAVATASKDTVYGLKAGTATITAQAGSLSATVNVTVVPSGQSSGSSTYGLGSSPLGDGISNNTPSASQSSSSSSGKGSVAPSTANTQPPQTTTPSSSAVTTTTAPAPVTYSETTGGVAHTWTDYTNASGEEGPYIAPYETVQIACKVIGFVVADGNHWWYRIASGPWSNAYYVSSDAFYNNGDTSGSLHGTPFVDPAVPDC